MARGVVVMCCLVLVASGCTHTISSPNGHESTGVGNAQASGALPPPAQPIGDPTWRITRLGAPHAIEGWVDRASARPGQPVSLRVSSSGRPWYVTVYRMGWYGGALATVVWRSGIQPGVPQPAAKMIKATNTVYTTWRPSLRLPTAEWSPGAYLLRLDSDIGQRYVPLTISTPDPFGRLLLIDPVTTWQAYNDWGGYSSYHGPGGEGNFDDRAVVVSFDRPYTGNGSSDFIGSQLPIIAHAERLGLPLGYATDIDLHADPHLLSGVRAVISIGHDEYWSTAMRNAVTAARDAGTNIAFLSANAVFRHIRFASSPTGPNRLETNYKRTTDPLYGRDNKEVTVDWREPPVSDPESSLVGAFYECNPVDAAMVITDPSNWIFAGTGATRGLRLPHLVGSEYDRVNPGAPTPPNMEVLTHSPLTCRGVRSFSDSSYYTVTSGAGVFDAGTSWFPLGLPEAGATGRTGKIIGGELTNLLTAFAAGPAGRKHPARRNIDALHEYAGDPIGVPGG